jgi:hypothetical protein
LFSIHKLFNVGLNVFHFCKSSTPGVISSATNGMQKQAKRKNATALRVQRSHPYCFNVLLAL